MSSMIHIFDEMPQSGQFIAGWVYEGTDWCATFKWIRGELHVYNERGVSRYEEWTKVGSSRYFDMAETVVFIKLEKSL